jgi:feruloyl esterase
MKHIKQWLIGVAGLAVAVAAAPAPAMAQAEDQCGALASLALPDARIMSAETVAAGAFTPPGRGGPVYATLPAFCRISATLRPTADSDIRMEVWLPASGWNGRFQAVGNGGWAGSISYPALATAVAEGYAAASTDTGHVGGSGSFALGHPEKVVDFGHRAVHEMAVQAKSVIRAHYGTAPTRSYFNGCSNGGRQGLAEAQRYPDDFDGIVAGAAAWNYMQIHSGRIAINQRVNRTPDSRIPEEKLSLLHAAAIEACDAHDRVADGVLEHPPSCQFDPGVLECKGAEGPTCLTAPQVDTARLMYAPITHPDTGAPVYPGVRPGSELGWNVIAGPEPVRFAVEAFRYVVFENADWDPGRFNLAADLARAVAKDHGVLGTSETNLQPFFERGGKLLMYHGWNDAQVAPDMSIAYLNAVSDRVGRTAVEQSMRVFMVPGMNHCAGGSGTDTFDKVAVLREWVEEGTAPDRIVASHLTDGRVDRTRPLCRVGQVARWDGVGATDTAASFACVAEAAGAR